MVPSVIACACAGMLSVPHAGSTGMSLCTGSLSAVLAAASSKAATTFAFCSRLPYVGGAEVAMAFCRIWRDCVFLHARSYYASSSGCLQQSSQQGTCLIDAINSSRISAELVCTCRLSRYATIACKAVRLPGRAPGVTRYHVRGSCRYDSRQPLHGTNSITTTCIPR
jgi:hypothetical protein